MSTEEFRQLPEDLQEIPYQVADDLLFGPIVRQGMTVSKYYNHSCNPNAGFSDSITLVAMRTIQSGEEVTFDYCMSMSSPIFRLDCECGESLCRKVILGSDWKSPLLQAKYEGYFVPYLKDKIARLKR